MPNGARILGLLALVGLLGFAVLRSASRPGAIGLETAFPRSSLPFSTTSAGADGGGQQFVVAEADRGPIGIYWSPEAPSPAFTLANPNGDGAPVVFLVLDEQAGEWLRVLVPVRPNDSTGWVRLADVTLRTDPYGVRVELGRHRVTVWRAGDMVMDTRAGVGRAATNTPKGVYFITELLRSPDPDGLYGPYAFGTSAYSDVLNEFAGGQGAIGIHGTNDPSGIGKDVSHGCVRVANDAITRLASFLPLGTPVFITP